MLNKRLSMEQRTRFAAYTSGGHEAVSPSLLKSLARAYAEVFAAPPWNEHWTETAVSAKVAREFSTPDAFLTLMLTGEHAEVVGFCWGTIITSAAVMERVCAAHPAAGAEALASVIHNVGERVMFVDEIAILPSYRDRGTGFTDLVHLVWPVVTAIRRQNVGVLCWSGSDSRIVPILTGFLDFEMVGTAGEISFYHLAPERGVPVVSRLIEKFGRAIHFAGGPEGEGV